MKIYGKIKGCLAATLMICAVLCIGMINVKAETGTGTIKGTNVNVRSDAGTNASRVNTLSSGDAVIVTGSKKDAAGNTWYQVKFTKNSREYTGYIIQTYVNYKAAESTSSGSDNTAAGNTSNQAQQTSTSKWQGKVTASSVNVRQSPVSGSVVASVSTGKKVTVRKSQTGTDGKVWYYITFDSKTKEGWIRSDFVKAIQTQTQSQAGAQTGTSGTTEIDASGALAEEAEDEEDTAEEDTGNDSTQSSGNASTSSKWQGKVKGSNVNVRQSPVSGSVVAKVSTGKTVTVRKTETGSDGKTWYYITFDSKSKQGWIRYDFVEKKETQQTSSGNDTKEDNSENDDKTETKGMMKGDYVRVRKKPVNGSVICQLMTGTALVIEGEETGTDNMVWYKVSFTYNGQQKSGYVRSDFVEVQKVQEDTGDTAEEGTEVDITSSEEFEAYLTQQGFPESYKNALRSLHNSHPEWEFRAVATGLNWDDVIAAESKVGRNLVAKNSITSWKSTEKTAYNWKTDSWYTFDGGAWVAASKELISYYIDPRNFPTEQAIFQFESLEYETYQNKEGVKRLLKDSFMSGKFTEPDGTQKTYAYTFVKVGKKVGVSPYHLAARCYQEQGKGTSGSVTGKVEGYENIFNYYNIGAYASGGNSPVVQGLKYAASSTGGSTNYERPWNTHYKSLLGGGRYVAQKYVKVGQNTLYFQKFNVVNKKNGIYTHQYMTNVQAAESEAIKMSKAYTAEDTKLVFYIPVYNNMPESSCAKPISNTNPNNYLASLEIKDQQLTPVFSPETETYDLTVPKSVKKVKISASTVSASAKVEGTGKIKLERGENVVKIICTAENGAKRTYTIHIVRE